MASHHSGISELQGQSRQVFLEAHQGSQHTKAAVFCLRNELSIAPQPHTLPMSQERGQWTDSLATHHAEVLRAVATSEWEGDESNGADCGGDRPSLQFFAVIRIYMSFTRPLILSSYRWVPLWHRAENDDLKCCEVRAHVPSEAARPIQSSITSPDY